MPNTDATLFEFHDDLVSNFEGFLPATAKHVRCKHTIPTESGGIHHISGEHGYAGHMHKKENNKYAEKILQNPSQFNDALGFGGIPAEEIERIKHDAPHIYSIIFDWDKTLNVCEGFTQMSSVLPDMHNDLIVYLLGGKYRFERVKEMFEALIANDCIIIILTNNPEIMFNVLINKMFKMFELPADRVYVIQNIAKTKQLILKYRKAQLLLKLLSSRTIPINKKTPISEEEYDKIMKGFFGTVRGVAAVSPAKKLDVSLKSESKEDEKTAEEKESAPTSEAKEEKEAKEDKKGGNLYKKYIKFRPASSRTSNITKKRTKRHNRRKSSKKLK